MIAMRRVVLPALSAAEGSVAKDLHLIAASRRVEL